MGIGGLPAYSTMTKAYLPNEEVPLRKELSAGNVSGDICYNFIDEEGELTDCTWNDRVLAISLSELKQIPKRIGVSGGKEKSADKSSVKGKLVNVLITDEETAKTLLDEDK